MIYLTGLGLGRGDTCRLSSLANKLFLLSRRDREKLEVDGSSPGRLLLFVALALIIGDISARPQRRGVSPLSRLPADERVVAREFAIPPQNSGGGSSCSDGRRAWLMAGWDNDLLPPITVELERMADLLTPPLVMPLVFRRLELAREDGMRGVSCRSELFNISYKIISNINYKRKLRS